MIRENQAICANLRIDSDIRANGPTNGKGDSDTLNLGLKNVVAANLLKSKIKVVMTFCRRDFSPHFADELRGSVKGNALHRSSCLKRRRNLALDHS